MRPLCFREDQMSRRRRIPREPVQAEVTKLSHEGRGIATIEGKTTFIRGALPGETVSFKYTNCRGQFDEGVLLEVLQPAANRVQAKCAVYGQCGGCNMQHLSREDQIYHKQNVLADLFKQNGHVAPQEWLQPLSIAEWGYRTKARLGVKYVEKKGGALVGFREIDGRFLTDMNACEILHPSVGQKLPEFKALMGQLDAKAEIPQLEIAVDDTKTAVIVRHLRPLSEQDVQTMKSFADTHGFIWYLQPKGPDTIHCIWPESAPEHLEYTLPDHQVKIAFQPQDFTQINQPLNQKMVQLAIDLLELKSTDRVLDLFCGLGNFTLPMARYAGEVIGIEGEQPMVERAGANAKRNGIGNTEFYAANLFESEYRHTQWWPYTYDKLLLDPPRAGAKEIIEALKEKCFERIVYVSCNPATLARDAELLMQQGYRLQSAGVMNMFPQTAHVESIALFTQS